MSTTLDKQEAAILGRVIAPENADLSPEAAQSLLALSLSPADQVELQRLGAKAKDGSLSPIEEADLENYRHVGRLLELMKSKARLSLKRSAMSADETRA